MSRLTKLEIRAYRSLRDVELAGFGALNLLVGGNNAGKTSILEAIGLLARPFDPGQWVQTVTSRDATGSLLDGLWSLFPGSTAAVLEAGQADSTPIDMRGEFGRESRHLTASARLEMEQWADIDSAGAEGHIEANVQVNANVEMQDASSHAHSMDFYSAAAKRRVSASTAVRSFRAFSVSPMLHRSTWQLVGHLSHAIDTGVKERSVEILSMFDPDVKDVLISRSIDRDTIRVDHAKKGMVDLSTFGDGMRRAFAMSLALTRASGGILLVDELESAIHTQALDSILPWLAQAAGVADVQIVATTHSLEAIDAVIGAVAESESGLVTYYLRSTDAGPVCTRYDLAGLRDLRAEGLDIR